MHSDIKKRRSSFLVALLFDAGDLRRYLIDTRKEEPEMNSVIPVIGGLVGLLWVFVGPIYCVVKLAAFKKRSKVGWGLFAVVAMVPSFIAVSLLPSLRAADEKKAYTSRFTRQYNRTGYVLTAVLSLVLVGLYYFRYVSNPTTPPLWNSWLHIHFILLSVACSTVLTAFVLSFIRLRNNGGFPAVILVLQNATVILLFSSIIAGVIWARAAFGSYWSWDPKETWSLILLSTSIMIYTYTSLRVPSRISHLLVSTVHVGLFGFAILGIPYLIGGLWPAL
jgi:ABC-type transport system involved in cytochrome c biogenesis permease subunit